MSTDLKCMRVLNDDEANEREQIVFGMNYSPARYEYGGISYFDDMDTATARKLMDLGYINPDDAQNCAPISREMIEFCENTPGNWYLHGYVVSKDRNDSRITFEGVGSNDILNADQALEFYEMFRFADELEAHIGGTAYCWYD